MSEKKSDTKSVRVYDKNGNGIEIPQEHQSCYVGKGYSLQKPEITKTKEK